MTSRPHDALFKAAFETPAHAAGLFRGVLPEAFVEAIAWDTLAPEPGSLVDHELADRQTDLLFSAKAGESFVFLYLLLEHRSTNDPDMVLRILGYLQRALERFRMQNPHEPLPLPVAVVVSHAPEGWTAPRALWDLFGLHPTAIPGVADFVPRLSILVEDLAHLTNDDIRSHALAAFPSLALWALRDARNGATLLANFGAWVDTFHAMLREPNGMEAFAHLLRYVQLVANDLLFDQFCAKLRQLGPRAEETAMTIAEQMRREGDVRGVSRTLRKLLSLKFGQIGKEHEERIDAATPEELDRYVERVLTAETVEAVFRG